MQEITKQKRKLNIINNSDKWLFIKAVKLSASCTGGILFCNLKFSFKKKEKSRPTTIVIIDPVYEYIDIIIVCVSM